MGSCNESDAQKPANSLSLPPPLSLADLVSDAVGVGYGHLDVVEAVGNGNVLHDVASMNDV